MIFTQREEQQECGPFNVHICVCRKGRDMRLPVCDLVNTFFDRTGR